VKRHVFAYSQGRSSRIYVGVTDLDLRSMTILSTRATTRNVFINDTYFFRHRTSFFYDENGGFIMGEKWQSFGTKNSDKKEKNVIEQRN